MQKDQLSWDEFYKVSHGRSKLPKKISEFNRLIAHTKNFFVISGYFLVIGSPPIEPRTIRFS